MGADDNEKNDAADDNEEEGEEGERIDKEEDRSYNEKLVGERIKGNYENGWATGTIQWFNSKLLEYNVLFEDGSEDYITTDDIDGVDIILVPSTEYEKKPIYKRPRSPLVKDDDSDSDFTVSDDSDDGGDEEAEEEESEKSDDDEGSIGPSDSEDERKAMKKGRKKKKGSDSDSESDED